MAKRNFVYSVSKINTPAIQKTIYYKNKNLPK